MIENKNRNKEDYFGVNEEEAVLDFILAESVEERTLIYQTRLKKTIDKLVESIINKFKLHRVGFTFEENHTDTVSFLICQSGKFKPEKNKKAFSYYGTICKNYLVAEIQKQKRNTKTHYDYDDYSQHLEESDDYSYSIENDDINTSTLISKMIGEIENVLSNPQKEGMKKLTENEIKLGHALIEIFSNYDVLMDVDATNTKYHKNSVLATIRNFTSLTTKDIRTALTRYKNIYKFIKEDEIENGSID